MRIAVWPAPTLLFARLAFQIILEEEHLLVPSHRVVPRVPVWSGGIPQGHIVPNHFLSNCDEKQVLGIPGRHSILEKLEVV